MVNRDALEGQRPLVTDATSGVGSAVARELRSRAMKTTFRRFHADASAAGDRSETGPIVDWRESRLGLKEETVR
jgi:uncharacterized protein YbjT (DUF2867 family)